jgi:predicted TIM-barrel fold metal-dependent hydrolase
LLDRDGISHALLYPSLGLQWEAEVTDPGYALAHTRAYNRWIEEFCAGSGGRLVPIAHLTLGDAEEAARELRRAVAAGARGGFLLPFTLSGVPHGHPAHDPLFTAAEELDVPIAIHTGIDPVARSLHHRFDGLAWPDGVLEGIWYLQLMFPQAVQQAFSTFFLHATFDRFPRLRLVVLESGAGWLGFWLDRMDALWKGSLRVTMPLREPPSTYVRRQVWISADPDERSLPPTIDYVGTDRFLWATDYPHSDHDADYMEELHALRPPARRAARTGRRQRSTPLQSHASVEAPARAGRPEPSRRPCSRERTPQPRRRGPSTQPSPSGSRYQPPAACVPPSTCRRTPVT